MVLPLKVGERRNVVPPRTNLYGDLSASDREARLRRQRIAGPSVLSAQLQLDYWSLRDEPSTTI